MCVCRTEAATSKERVEMVADKISAETTHDRSGREMESESNFYKRTLYFLNEKYLCVSEGER